MHTAFLTSKVAMAATSFPALLDSISGSEPGEGLAGAGESVDLPAQLSLPGALLANDAGCVEAEKVIHEVVGEIREDNDRGEVGQQPPLLREGGREGGRKIEHSFRRLIFILTCI